MNLLYLYFNALYMHGHTVFTLYLQELALQMKMTMRETMYYFGILFKMNLKHVNKRTDFLKGFLSISSADTLCGKLR